MTHNRFHREKEILKIFCNEKRLHHSDKRVSILELFLKIERHITAEELWNELNKANTNADLKTVISSLEIFIKAGLAREIYLEDGKIYFEHIFAHNHHDHLICRRCGKLIEFVSLQLEKIQDIIAAKHEFTVEDHLLTIYGICNSCALKIKVAEQKPLPKEQRENLVPLNTLKPGQYGEVKEINCGIGFSKRLAAIGIRTGKRVTKVSAMLMNGPVVISIDGRQLAIGNGMANKVLVDINIK